MAVTIIGPFPGPWIFIDNNIIYIYINIMDMMLQKIRDRKRRHKEALALNLDGIKRQLIGMGAEKLVLFGSFNRGDINSWSDIDLLVIMPATKTGKEWSGEIYETVERDVDCDFFVYTRAELETILPVSSFLRHALRTGKVIYERGS